MPYIVSFSKKIEIVDPEQYINDCCIGGDIVLEQFLPMLRERYDDLQSNQEDWGWFAWFEQSRVKLAVDVYTHEATAGEFQIHLTSRAPRLLLGPKIQDTPELEALRELIVSKLQSWNVSKLEVERVNEKYMPT
ncbi:hypothetical protein [Undibacterium curvum]|jgi:hypothetical protein|uniref:hypothetical protein n=1 Tax=Undibacterium curvum TaxID=2762294 RepID=UPI003D14820C